MALHCSRREARTPAHLSRLAKKCNHSRPYAFGQKRGHAFPVESLNAIAWLFGRASTTHRCSTSSWPVLAPSHGTRVLRTAPRTFSWLRRAYHWGCGVLPMSSGCSQRPGQSPGSSPRQRSSRTRQTHNPEPVRRPHALHFLPFSLSGRGGLSEAVHAMPGLVEDCGADDGLLHALAATRACPPLLGLPVCACGSLPEAQRAAPSHVITRSLHACARHVQRDTPRAREHRQLQNCWTFIGALTIQRRCSMLG